MVYSLLGCLVAGSFDGKTPFWRSECCRLISFVLKRKNFPEAVQAQIVKECTPLASNISRVLSSCEETGGGESKKDSDRRAKRLKPILQCLKELSFHLVQQRTKSAEKTIQALQTSLDTVAQESVSLAPIVKTILSTLGGTALSSSSDQKKRKSDLPSDTLPSSSGAVAGKNPSKSESDISLMRDWDKEDQNDAKKRKIAKEKRNNKLYKV